MIVFSNTTPLIALSSIGQLDLLPRLFTQVHLVGEVIDECAVGGTIAVPDLRSLPWVKEVKSTPVQYPTVLLELDKGEKHTLDMARKLNADWVVIDEKIGRNMAEYLGLKVTGTLGVLLKARQQNWIPSFRDAAEAMMRQGIRYNSGLVERLAWRMRLAPPVHQASPQGKL
jgi:predicted nucleic acid-binding protein